MSGKHYSAEDDKVILSFYRRASIPTLLHKLGRPVLGARGIVAHMHKLEEAGLLEWDARRKRGSTPWTKQDDLRLQEMWGWYSAEDIGKALNRTKNSIQKRARAINLPYVESTYISANATARLFKVETLTVIGWIHTGMLTAQLGTPPTGLGVNGSKCWNIKHSDLLAFVEKYPFIVDWRVIEDKFWRDVVYEAAKGEVWLSTGQVAILQKVSQVIVGRWCRLGRIRCEYAPLLNGRKRYYIPQSALKEIKIVRKRPFKHVPTRRVSSPTGADNSAGMPALLAAS